ncbi:hypothetical protein C0J52_06915 [Blattella germanica]|nr:hypothetical protein C0J52_06915 [Blattella germanica]
MHVVGGATVSNQEEQQIQLEDQSPQEQQSSHADTSHTSELDDNGNNGSSQNVEEAQEDVQEKGNNEEESVQRNSLDGCQIIQNTYYTEESEPQDEDGASSDGNRNFSDENTKCRPTDTEWDGSFGNNRLSVVNRGSGGIDGVLRQGHQERLHLKWHIEQQVSTRDWISLCNLGKF